MIVFVTDGNSEEEEHKNRIEAGERRQLQHYHVDLLTHNRQSLGEQIGSVINPSSRLEPARPRDSG